MNVLELIEKTTRYFQERNVPSSRLQIELLLAHVLQIPRLNLYLQFDRELTSAELDSLRPLVKRRGEHEPIQYILGETSFCGLPILCRPGSLIPRPETEVLVELASNSLDSLPAATLVDVGTGSGAIALALAHRLPKWTVTGTDFSAESLSLARDNQSHFPHLDNVSWQEGHLLAGLEPQAVISNLPYLTTGEMTQLPPDVRHEPVHALHSGDDGLDLVRELISSLPNSVRFIALELGVNQAATVAGLLRERGFATVRRERDLADVERFVVGEK